MTKPMSLRTAISNVVAFVSATDGVQTVILTNACRDGSEDDGNTRAITGLGSGGDDVRDIERAGESLWGGCLDEWAAEVRQEVLPFLGLSIVIRMTGSV